MKKALLVSAMVLLFAAGGFAQEMKPAIYIGGGLSMPMSPDIFKDNWKMGFHGGAGVGFQVHPMFEIIGRAHYNMFSMDLDEYIKTLAEAAGATIDGGSYKALEVMADVKFLIPIAPEGEDAPFQPFLLGGVGIVNQSISDVDVTTETETYTITVESQTDLAFGFGAGFEYMASPKASIFVEGKYTMIQTEGETTAYVPIRVGLKYLLGGE